MNSKKIKHPGWLLVLLAVFSLFYFPLSAQTPVSPESPEKFFGFYPGSDRMLFDYETQINYFKKLESASPRIKLEQIGVSPMGKPMYLVFISAEENIKNLPALKEINRKLALDAQLSEADRADCFNKGKVFVLGTLSMHSEEVAPAQASVLIAYDLATTTDPEKLNMLHDVVYMMTPNHNPDGMDMVVNHYKKYKGTKYEGSPLPSVYHKYVGHDNNRDFVTLTQSDSKAIAAIYNLNWFPQVMVEKHQMGSRGPRYYVPLNHDPIAEIIDAGIWNWNGIFGSNMIKDMTNAGLSGVVQHYIFDNYWPGSTETCIWKNVIGFLTEAASVNVASPIFIELNELSAREKGLSEYKKSVNMPLPWPGGWWRLSDIVQYEVVSTQSILQTASLHRTAILKFRNDLCKKEVNNGKTQPPYYYILPLKQHDGSELVNLVNLLKEHGIDVFQLTQNTIIANKNFQAGDIVVPLSQPFRPFLIEVMEPQQYPVRHFTPDGDVMEPYDITSWSLPLHMGVKSIAITKKESLPADFDTLLEKIQTPYPLNTNKSIQSKALLLPVSHNGSFHAAFLALKEGFAVSRLQKSIEINNVTYEPGCFIINPTNKNNTSFTSILQQVNAPAVSIDEPSSLSTQPVKMPRIGLIETYFHDMDAGWTRFVLDSYAIPFKVLHPGEIASTDLQKNFDVLIFPDSDKNLLLDGKDKFAGEYYISSMIPEYTKGIGKKGLEMIFQFVDNGGIILTWGDSAELFMGIQELTVPKQPKEEFQLPINNIAEKLAKEGLSCPGSLMKLDLLPDHPLTRGLPLQIGVFYRGKPVFQTNIPNQDMDRRVIGKFPETDILLSGYCTKPELVGNQSACVWLKKNKGQLVMFAFSPIFRASTHITYKLLFNAILLEPLK